jgi:hypothetical protein
MSRLFSDEELGRLERSPHEQVRDALAVGDLDELRSLVGALERAFIGTVAGTRNWTAHTIAFVATDRSAEDLAALVRATQLLFAAYPETIDPDDDPPESVTNEIIAIVRSGDHDAALARFDAMEAHWRDLQDLYRDWLSALLSEIYRAFGIDALDRCLRHSAEQTLFSWTPVDMARPPERRLPSWVRMFQGHFSRITIEEDDEKFTLVQDPCGTCTRQIEQGRYGPPLDLAIVTEHHEATWFRGDTPIYRAHVPVWHVALAGERFGVPWPVNQCPAGLGTGPCRTLIYKDPLNPDAKDAVPR